MHTVPHNILLTGASGYLGGDLLAELVTTDLPEHGKLFALVRSSEQAGAVKQLGAEPLTLETQFVLNKASLVGIS
jgi:thioester reductase-like protein